MNILNVINFVRSVDPRDPKLDLYEPVKRQLALAKEYNLPVTFLLQYDVMLEERYVRLLKDTLNVELGVWLEVVQPLVENVGIFWRGRKGFSWDWHSDVGFTVGYTMEERKRIVDELMEKFREIFGYYPKSVGSWAIDAVTLEYLSEKYQIAASCNCKDQWGTDGYSLWGGYYNQGYYPSKYNMICPAQTLENQISVPVFRMLGSDPIDQYDAAVGEVQNVITLEPVYIEGGGSEAWTKWFFGEIFNGKSLSFGYTQAGQENSFGWKAMEKGYLLQMKLIAKMRDDNLIKVVTLGEAGRWYRENFSETPPSAIVAQRGEKSSVWYYSKQYRSNLYVIDDIPRVRDIFYFNDNYRERYLDKVCTGHAMFYDNLPMMDGNRWSTKEMLAGIYFTNGNEIAKLTAPISAETENNTVKVMMETNVGKIELVYEEEMITINTNLTMRMLWNNIPDTSITAEERNIRYEHNGFSYSLKTNGKVIDYRNGMIDIIQTLENLQLRFS